MREIKFRAWDKSAKRMYHVADMSFGSEGCLIVRTTDGNVFTGLKNAKEYELMQYTGLHDKNGKEIYEGDIVLCTMPFESFNAVVEFADGCFEIRSKKWRDYLKVYVANHAIEIIGNRWDNPELLKEGSV